MSLFARLGVALVCFEHYCLKHKINGKATDDFLDWMWAAITGALGETEFDNWLSASPDLVEIGLGFEVEGFENPTDASGVPAHVSEQFHRLVCDVTEILYSQLYSQPSRKKTLKYLENILDICSSEGIVPCLKPFHETTWDSLAPHTLTQDEAKIWRESMIK